MYNLGENFSSELTMLSPRGKDHLKQNKNKIKQKKNKAAPAMRGLL